jgi:hypothetical protein
MFGARSRYKTSVTTAVRKSSNNRPQVLASRECFNIADSWWTEYLCFASTADRVVLSICTYERLADADEYLITDKRGTRKHRLPREINSKRVVGIEDACVIGGDLQDWSGDQTLILDPQDYQPGDIEPSEQVRAWLLELGWEGDVDIDEVSERILAAIKSAQERHRSSPAR